MYERLREKGRGASDHYAGHSDYFDLSPAALLLLRALEKPVSDLCHGKVLDAGAGRGAYRNLLRRCAASYVGLDLAPGPATDLAGDVQRLPFAGRSFDAVFCSQVLEHVPEPLQALEEFRRVLKPSGYLILTVPHISWLHNEPHDYFRFTCHALRLLLGKAGFTPERIVPAGGLSALLGHVLSTVAVHGTFGIPVLHPAVRSANRFFVRVVAWLDGRVEKKKLFALNYVCIARVEEGIER